MVECHYDRCGDAYTKNRFDHHVLLIYKKLCRNTLFDNGIVTFGTDRNGKSKKLYFLYGFRIENRF